MQQEQYTPPRMTRLGVCAMRKKAQSKSMVAILAHMQSFGCFEVTVFEEGSILNDPVEAWPVCDALISFFSTGFPLGKAVDYCRLRNPFQVNNLEKQYMLLDRRVVYRTLTGLGIPVVEHSVLSRDGSDGAVEDNELVEEDNEDQIRINGKIIKKPFVEKPVAGEDHNIWIYYPKSAGGGIKKLFRKTGDQSSNFTPGA